jgi:hypothetical protein
MHETCTVQVAAFRAKGGDARAAFVRPFIKRSGALLERVAGPGGPARPLPVVHSDKAGAFADPFVLAHAISAATPGSRLPSIHSRKAPPAVET